MESRIKLLGHPVHQTLVVFPIGLLAGSVIFDLAHGLSGRAELAGVAYWLTAAGVVGALAAAPFGLMDWLSIPRRTRARRIGALHGGVNLAVVILFASSWALRREAPWWDPPALAHWLSALGVTLVVIAGWLGGELVVRLGVGVDDAAHLDASSSLSRSATAPH